MTVERNGMDLPFSENQFFTHQTEALPKNIGGWVVGVGGGGGDRQK